MTSTKRSTKQFFYFGLYWTLISIYLFIFLVSPVTGCASISALASSVGIPIGIKAAGLKICAISVRIVKWKSIIKKKETKHGEIVLLRNIKLNSIKVVKSKALI